MKQNTQMEEKVFLFPLILSSFKDKIQKET